MYKNFDDLEEHLTRQELGVMLEKAREKRYEDRKWSAALKGIDLDEGQDSKFEEINRRAQAKAWGIDEEQLELDGHFNIIEEDE